MESCPSCSNIILFSSLFTSSRFRPCKTRSWSNRPRMWGFKAATSRLSWLLACHFNSHHRGAAAGVQDFLLMGHFVLEIQIRSVHENSNPTQNSPPGLIRYAGRRSAWLTDLFMPPPLPSPPLPQTSKCKGGCPQHYTTNNTCLYPSDKKQDTCYLYCTVPNTVHVQSRDSLTLLQHVPSLPPPSLRNGSTTPCASTPCPQAALLNRFHYYQSSRI